jgi:hypothetical protein
MGSECSSIDYALCYGRELAGAKYLEFLQDSILRAGIVWIENRSGVVKIHDI